jgi:hypothetical protein
VHAREASRIDLAGEDFHHKSGASSATRSVIEIGTPRLISRPMQPCPTTIDLFEPSPITGLRYHDDFLNVEEERRIIGEIERVNLEPFRFQQWTGKRLTATFGWRYDFEKGTFGAADPIPPFLLRSSIGSSSRLFSYATTPGLGSAGTVTGRSSNTSSGSRLAPPLLLRSVGRKREASIGSNCY